MTPTFDPYHQWLGIAPDDQPANHYRLLGVGLFEADSNVIKHAADQRMAHLRTFQTGPRGQLSQRLLNEIATASRCLLTPSLRAGYDDELRRKRGYSQPQAEMTVGVVPIEPHHSGAGAITTLPRCVKMPPPVIATSSPNSETHGMGLVACSRCGKSVSKRAAACPRCGEPPGLVAAELVTPPAPPKLARITFTSTLLRWCTQRPVIVGVAIYIVLAVPMLLAALLRPDDETALLLTSVAILPGGLFGLGFGVWCTLPDATISGKLRRIGWSCAILIVTGFVIWLLANYTFAWYLLGIALLIGVCYIAYLAWKDSPQPAPKNSSWECWGVYMGVFLILTGAGVWTDTQRPVHQSNDGSAQVGGASTSSAIWSRGIGWGLIVLGIYNIKESLRRAVLNELCRGNSLPTNPAQGSPSSSEVPTTGIPSTSPTSPESST